MIPTNLCLLNMNLKTCKINSIKWPLVYYSPCSILCVKHMSKLTFFFAKNVVSSSCNCIKVSCAYRKEGNILFNDTFNTFYLWIYVVGHMVQDHSDSREETHCRHCMGYSFLLAARVLLYASSHRQDSTYHSLCYTSCGALIGTRNSSMGSP